VYKILALNHPSSLPLEINTDDFEKIKSGRSKLNRINEIEFNFWSVVEAHRELVDCTLLIANERAHHYKFGSIGLTMERSQISSRIDLFLIAFERYVSTCPGILNDLGIGNAKAEHSSPIFDTNFPYRLCCKLRNFAVHKLSAADGIIVQNRRNEIGGIGETSVIVSVSIKALLEWDELQAQLKNDLLDLEENGETRIDLMGIARKVCTLVWNIHISLRIQMVAVESELRRDLVLFQHSWECIQIRKYERLHLSAVHAEFFVPFLVDDDEAIKKLRELTEGNARLEKIRVCSHSL
jgi:hypothetical protein